MAHYQNTGLPDWDWWGKLWPTPGETLRELGLSSGDAVAEAGCGNGYFALPAARIVDPAPVYALDIDQSFLDELAHLADQQSIENVEPIRGDADDLPSHLPEPVDVVLVANVLHGVADPATFVQQISKSLAPGGRLVVVNWVASPREKTTVDGDPRGPPADLRMTPEETERTVCEEAERTVCEETEFALEDQTDLPPYHYGLVFER